MSQVVQLTQNLVSLTCWSTKDGACGIQFAMPQKFSDTCSQHGTVFHCPRGHALSYGESELVKANKRLEFEKIRREAAERDAEAFRKARDTARKAEGIAKGKLKAQSERVKNGVCPCCNRSFLNLQRHMATKHKDFIQT